MPTVEERFPRDYEEWNDDSRRRARLVRYFTVYTNDEVLASNSTPEFGSPWAESALVVTRKSAKRQESSKDSCAVTVTYELPDGASNPNEIEFRFNGVAQTTHITKPKTNADGTAAIVNYPPFAAEHGGLIGKKGDDVQGCDVYVPRLEYTATSFRTSLEAADILKLQGVVGKVNNATWKYWNKREVLFIGWTARKRGAERWQMEFTFQIEPKTTFKRERFNWDNPIEAQKEVEVITKEGWDYYWEVEADNETASGSGDIVIYSGIKSMHVARVYDEASFTDLGIGS